MNLKVIGIPIIKTNLFHLENFYQLKNILRRLGLKKNNIWAYESFSKGEGKKNNRI